jgi:hypothetical protein
MLPRSVENLLVAGRHYSATSAAQKISREIPPCMAMGEARVAAALALDAGVSVRDVDVAALQRTLRAQGADPGDQSGPNADVPPLADAFKPRRPHERRQPKPPACRWPASASSTSPR